jgi:hypothetical protein
VLQAGELAARLEGEDGGGVVQRDLMKLNLADRAHAVIFAYETGLVQPGETAP